MSITTMPPLHMLEVSVSVLYILTVSTLAFNLYSAETDVFQEN